LRYLTAKMAALLPFGRATEFLSELLPMSAETSVNTVRNRTMKVGKRLRKSAEVLANRSVSSSCEEAVLGLDGDTYGIDTVARNGTSRLWLARCSTSTERRRGSPLCARAVPTRRVRLVLHCVATGLPKILP
jgi:hypothetical protein